MKRRPLVFGSSGGFRAAYSVIMLAVAAHAIPIQTGVDEDGVTRLMIAARDGERKTAKALIKQGADVNASDAYGWTALTYASAYGDSEIVKLLLSKRCSVEASDGSDLTPLVAAVRFHNLSVVKLLIKNGADVNRVGSEGITPIAMALRGHQSKVVDVLRKAGAVDAPVTGDRPGVVVDSKPVALNFPTPRYTEEARQQRIQGTVSARLLVKPDGAVGRVRILRGLPYGLSYQATKAAASITFRPAIKNGVPVEYWTPILIEFNLK